MALQGKPVAIGNTATTIYTCPGGTEAAVHGLIFANNTASTLTVDLAFYDQTTGTTVTVATDLSVAANSYITWAKPINMNAGDYIQATSSASSGLVCLFSAYEGSAAPVATGFTARGVWSSASTYAVNDIVTVVGTGTYLAIQASTNQNPTSATAYWMFLEGVSASALPSQAGQGGKFLTTDGTDASWAVVDVAGGATVTAGASADITLSAASTRVHKVSFAGTGYRVILPNASTLSKGGAVFVIENKGEFASSISTANGLPVCSLGLGASVQIYLVDNSTVDGTWQVNLGTAQGEFAVSATANIDTSAPLAGSSGSVCQIADNKFLFAYMLTGANTTIYLRVAQFSSGTWTLGTRTSFSVTQGSSGTESWSYQTGMAKLDTDKAVLVHWEKNTSNNWQGRSRVITVSGTTITVGSNFDFSTSASQNQWMTDVRRLDTNSFVIGYSTYISSTWAQNLRAATVSGTTISYGTALTNIYDAWPGMKVVVDSPSLIQVFCSANGSQFPANIRPYTVSGNTLTVGTTHQEGGYPAPYYWGQPTTANTSNSIYFIAKYGADPHYVHRYAKDTSFSPPRWSTASSVGARAIALSNAVSGNDGGSILVYSQSGTVDRLALTNLVSAGLGGSGIGLSFMTFDTSTLLFKQSSISFLIGGDSVSAFDFRSNNDSRLMRNAGGDLFVPFKDPSTQHITVMQIGLAKV